VFFLFPSCVFFVPSVVARYVVFHMFAWSLSLLCSTPDWLVRALVPYVSPFTMSRIPVRLSPWWISSPFFLCCFSRRIHQLKITFHPRVIHRSALSHPPSRVRRKVFRGLAPFSSPAFLDPLFFLLCALRLLSARVTPEYFPTPKHFFDDSLSVLLSSSPLSVLPSFGWG